MDYFNKNKILIWIIIILLAINVSTIVTIAYHFYSHGRTERINNRRHVRIPHVIDQGVRQGGVEKHQSTASLENAKVRSHDLPVNLRHSHGHDLVRPCEEGSKGCSHFFGSCIELSEGQGLSGEGNLQGCVVREFPGGATENFCKPLDSFLMRNIYEVSVAKYVRQAVWASVCTPVWHSLRRPKVSPPRHIGHCKEDCEDGC